MKFQVRNKNAWQGISTKHKNENSSYAEPEYVIQAVPRKEIPRHSTCEFDLIFRTGGSYGRTNKIASAFVGTRGIGRGYRHSYSFGHFPSFICVNLGKDL